MKHGGKRTGSGRRKGSKTLTLRELLKQKDIDTFIDFLLANYMEDARLMMWMGDHIFGKAAQVLVGDPERPIPIMDVSTNQRHAQNSSAD